MPGGDRTGPRGEGPLTGWGRGYCRGGGPGWARGCGWGGGWGFRGGRGRGGGFRHGWGWRGGPDWSAYGPPSRDTELAWLREEAKNIEAVLGDLRARIADLEK
jgi:hypothetical protein